MRHKKAFIKFNRTPAHRRAMLRNLVTSLVIHDRIETTLPKAKALRRVADKLVTLGKTDSLHNRRQAMQYLYAINQAYQGNAQKLTAVHRLFTEIAPRYVERNGGYTRVVRTRKRDGDNTQLAVIEFVEARADSKPGEKRKRRVIVSDAAAPSEAAPAKEEVSSAAE